MSTAPAPQLPDWAQGSYTSQRTGETYYLVIEERSIVARTAEARHVGYITWGSSDPVIGNLHVHPDHQRRGIATELFRRAQLIEPELYHSKRLSNDAQAWIKAIGDTSFSAPTGASIQEK